MSSLGPWENCEVQRQGLRSLCERTYSLLHSFQDAHHSKNGPCYVSDFPYPYSAKFPGDSKIHPRLMSSKEAQLTLTKNLASGSPFHRIPGINLWSLCFQFPQEVAQWTPRQIWEHLCLVILFFLAVNGSQFALITQCSHRRKWINSSDDRIMLPNLKA